MEARFLLRSTPLLSRAFCCALIAGSGVLSRPVVGDVLSSEVADGRNQQIRQRVLIHFAGDSETSKALGPSAGDSDRRRLEAVRRIVDDALPHLAEHVESGDVVVDRVFRLQPAVSAEVSAGGLDALSRQPGVTRVELDRVLEPQTLEGLEVIGADVLHQLGFSGEGTAVAIIDTGVDYLHPTLGGGQIPNAKVVFGLDTADGDDDPMDCLGHGTAAASVAAGSSYQWDPNRRFAGGVAPAAKILAYKVTSDSDCRAAYTSAVVAALEDAVLRRDADGYRLAAINLSLGAGEYDGWCDTANLAYANAVNAATEAGVAVIAASGNQGFPNAMAVPACLANTIAVGSAWDTDPGALPFYFCLDETCSRTCDDSFKFTRSVACYSNSSPSLDLVAPSEFLKAAAASGVTVTFGGTSGAAAYATGAVALLEQALGPLDPSTAEFLLAASGTPSMDDKNGLIRSVIDLEAALEAAGKVVVSDPVSVLMPPVPDGPTRSTIFVDRAGEIGSVKILVDLAHPEPEQLRLTLESPDGTRVLLHDRGSGFLDGINGTYPDDFSPVESLGRFAGVPASGGWSLEVEDLRTQTAGGTETVRFAWALEIAELGDPSAAVTTMVYPVVAHVQGSQNTQWRSDVRLFNPIQSHDSEIRLHFLPPSGEDSFARRQTDVIVPHHSVVALDDVVKNRFGLDSAFGSLLVEDPSGTLVHGTSRTFTVGENGSYGQFVAPEVGAASAAGAGDPALVVLPNAGPDHRVNIGVTEVAGKAVTVAMTLVDNRNGVALGPSAFFEVEGFSNTQLNGVLPDLELAADLDPYVSLTVVQGEGRITAYGSIIDNLSGDAVFVDGSTPRVAPYLLIPVVARTEGQAGTQWRSDLRVLNHGSFSVHIDAELRFHGSIGLPSVTESFELQPGQAITIEDVVGTLFGHDSAVGSLRLVPREGATALLATSRTANHGGSVGTYGQHVRSLRPDDGLTEAGVLLHVDKSAVRRSNLGLVETAGKSVGVAISLLDEHGNPLGATTRMTLGPWESIQINDVFGALGGEEETNARIELTRDAGNGAFFAYASVIDSVSGDAIFVPVQPLD
jgi:subtilisin family serine protease/subtilisin-like proprotein convertase family protein